MSERKFYTSIAECNADWLAAFAAKGHQPKLGEDGDVDHFAYNPFDPHNWPACVKCDEGWCWHCTHPEDIQPCKGSDHGAYTRQSALEGR